MTSSAGGSLYGWFWWCFKGACFRDVSWDVKGINRICFSRLSVCAGEVADADANVGACGIWVKAPYDVRSDSVVIASG